MAAAKKSTKKSAAKKSTAKKTPAKKAAAKKTPAKKATAKKAAAKKSTARKSAARKSTARKSTASSGSNVQLVVASRIKEAAKGQDVRVAGDFAEAFNAEVNEMLSRAIARTKSNGRGTVRPGDL